MSEQTITEKEARQLANEIKQNLVNLEQNLKLFHQVQGWVPLGYDSFTVWWDNEMRDLPVAQSVRYWAVHVMLEENTVGNRIVHGMVPVMAQAAGLAPSTITGMKSKSRRRAKIRAFGKRDEEPAVVSVVIPTRWHRHLIALSVRKDQPMADFLRPIIKEGMMRNHGIDLDRPLFEEE